MLKTTTSQNVLAVLAIAKFVPVKIVLAVLPANAVKDKATKLHFQPTAALPGRLFSKSPTDSN